MRIQLRDRPEKQAAHLRWLQNVPVMAYKASELRFRMDEVAFRSSIGAPAAARQILLDYHIFPPHIMSGYGQWTHEGRGMRPGDTIVQQVLLPPLHGFSLKLVFGVRISQVIQEEDRAGFSYETLEGHVERGISTFLLERTSEGLLFRISTRSGPGHWTTRLTGPVVARPYQRHCTLQALAHVRRQIEAMDRVGG